MLTQVWTNLLHNNLWLNNVNLFSHNVTFISKNKWLMLGEYAFHDHIILVIDSDTYANAVIADSLWIFVLSKIQYITSLLWQMDMVILFAWI